MAIKTIFITSGTTFTIPSDFGSLVSVECLGAGGGIYAPSIPSSLSRSGGGGGGYAKTTAITGLAANGTAFVNVGAGATTTNGGNTWFNGSANAEPTVSTEGALARGGGIGGSGAGVTGVDVNGGGGSLTGANIGSTIYTGGNGGL